MTTAYAVRLATPKQIAFVNRLAGEKDLTPELAQSVAMVESSPSRAASSLINILIDRPRRRVAPAATAAAAAAELTDGMYLVGNKIFKAYIGQSGRLLCKELVQGFDAFDDAWSFEYRGMAHRYVKVSDKMSLVEAKEFGAIYGICCCCGRTLTDEGSIAAGIGPICARRF
jgi:hypothetical protein